MTSSWCLILQEIWHSEDRVSWYILIIKPKRCTIPKIYFWNRTLHASDCFTVHHLESSTVHTAMGICHTVYADCLLADQDGTAGVYLLIPFSPSVSYWLNVILLLVSGLLIFITGLGANLECDLKRIISLSTFRQLDLTIMTISFGLSSLVFFHLLTHALFHPDPANRQST